MELLRNALDVIQSIDANDEFDAGEPLLQLQNPLLNRIFGEVLDVTAGCPSGVIVSEGKKRRGNVFQN